MAFDNTRCEIFIFYWWKKSIVNDNYWMWFYLFLIIDGSGNTSCSQCSSEYQESVAGLGQTKLSHDYSVGVDLYQVWQDTEQILKICFSYFQRNSAKLPVRNKIGKGLANQWWRILSLIGGYQRRSLTLADPIHTNSGQFGVFGGFLEVLRPNTWLFFHIDMFMMPVYTSQCQSGPSTQFALRRFCRWWWRWSLPECYASQIFRQQTATTLFFQN